MVPNNQEQATVMDGGPAIAAPPTDYFPPIGTQEAVNYARALASVLGAIDEARATLGDKSLRTLLLEAWSLLGIAVTNERTNTPKTATNALVVSLAQHRFSTAIVNAPALFDDGGAKPSTLAPDEVQRIPTNPPPPSKPGEVVE